MKVKRRRQEPATHPCMRCGSDEWTDVDYGGCSDCREPLETWWRVNVTGQQGERIYLVEATDQSSALEAGRQEYTKHTGDPKPIQLSAYES